MAADTGRFPTNLATASSPGAMTSPISDASSLTTAEVAALKAELPAAQNGGWFWKSGDQRYCLSPGAEGLTLYRTVLIDGTLQWIEAAKLGFGQGMAGNIIYDAFLVRGTSRPNVNPSSHGFEPQDDYPIPTMAIVASDLVPYGGCIGAIPNEGNLLYSGVDTEFNLTFTVNYLGAMMLASMSRRGGSVVTADNGGNLVASVAPPLDTSATLESLISALQLIGLVKPTGAGFVTKWTVAGDETARTITLPLRNVTGALIDCVVDWGDGTALTTIKAYNSSSRIHTYAADGTYNVEICGACESFDFQGSGDAAKCVEVVSWGNDKTRFGGFKNVALYGCTLTAIEQAAVPASGTGCTTLATMLWSSGVNPNLTTIPAGFLAAHTAARDSSHAFRELSNLTTVPSRLLAGAELYQFYATFYEDPKLKIESDLFFSPGEEFTRFASAFDDTCDFRYCFYRTSFYGVQGTAPTLWLCDFGETITLDVAPATDWQGGEVITGQSSGATCTVLGKVSDLVYHVYKHFGTFTLGEVIGVTGTSAKLAEQGAANPVFAHTPLSEGCFGGAGNSSASLSNYESIPASWK